MKTYLFYFLNSYSHSHFHASPIGVIIALSIKAKV